MEMEIVRPTWKRNISMKGWGNGLDYSMTYITEPARDKGQVFMKRETEMWNWMPTIRQNDQNTGLHDVSGLDGFRLYQR